MTQPIDRRPQRRLKRHPSQDGDGVAIHRLHDFGGGLDPFLMLDELEAAPHDNAIGGFPPHPHRGIQTLTYVLHGGLRHEDHLGHHSSIGAGGAQWMHTGRGIIHGETPFADAHGLHAFQLWLNLAASDKMSEPTYRDVPGDEMPHLTRPGARLTALGGDWVATDGERVSGPLDALAGRAGVAHVTLAAGGDIALEADASTLLVFVFAGQLEIAGDGVTRGELVRLGDGGRLSLASDAGAQALLLAGEPHGEPIAHYGPFVMNHRHELDQALRDYRDGSLTD
ncbi:pirin family protein [Halomonas sp. ND22Bw]|uniref:pirin family protein n=1 Tax=Halomonas TaxID=2745 RepID=UPI0006916D92|nr:pirin family protein [Halomonas salina]PSJ22004.1 pirin family protein [Halomonas sp. ND22Bw]